MIAVASLGEAPADVVQVHGSLGDLIDSASESQRSWRLRCIRAEAELRRAGAAGVAGAAAAADADEVAKIEVLSQVLAFERQLGELDAQREHVASEVAAARSGSEAAEARLRDESWCLQQAKAEAADIMERASSVVQEYRALEAAHEARCQELLADIPQDDGAVNAALSEAQSAWQALTREERAACDDADAAREKRERLLMRGEELRGRRRHAIEAQAQSFRDVAWARKAVQTRGVQIRRLEGEAQRSRMKGDRMRRQMEAQLTQCQNELADSTGRLEIATEQLRKVKQQHGAQLRRLREKSGGLQQEVDDHLRHMEASEDEILRLKGEAAELEQREAGHFEQEEMLAGQIQALRSEGERLRQQVGLQDAECEAAQAQLMDLETICEAESRAVAAQELQVETQEQVYAQAEASCAEVRLELQEELEGCSRQAAEMQRLQALSEEVQEAKAKRDQVAGEHRLLQEASRQFQSSSERHVADLQEATRRATRLRTSHAELADSLRNVGAVDQAVGRAAKKADALYACLEGARKQPLGLMATAGSAEVSTGSSPRTAPRQQLLLQRRLRVEAERELHAAVVAQRQRLLEEQERAVQEARRRTNEIQHARRERRGLEEELARYRTSLSVSQQQLASEEEAWEAQVLRLDMEAEQGALALEAELSDLLQKQSVEKAELQREIEILRGEIVARDTAAAIIASRPPHGEAGSLAEVQEKLLQMDIEAQRLRAEKDRVQSAHVKLKAALVAEELGDQGGVNDDVLGQEYQPSSRPASRGGSRTGSPLLRTASEEPTVDISFPMGMLPPSVTVPSLVSSPSPHATYPMLPTGALDASANKARPAAASMPAPSVQPAVPQGAAGVHTWPSPGQKAGVSFR